MKRTLSVCALLCTALIFSSLNLNAQINPGINNLSAPAEKCGFDNVHQEKLANDPNYLQNTIDLENYVANYNPDGKVSSTPYRIPVVVHVMETGNSLTAITDAQIREAIKQLNERYRKVPGTAGDGAGVDVELEFSLAVRDPSGNCTNGIVRYDMTGNATYMASGVFRNSAGITDVALKALSFWDSFEYYNIWIVSEIDDNDGGSGIQGYAYFASAHGQTYDGAVIMVSNFKNPASTTGVHELGHAFNLYHTFDGDGGGGSCPTNGNCLTDGDRVCDTPPHMRSGSDCVVAANGCDGGSSSTLFIHNYMDYSSDACQSEFTAGQKVRVAAAMTGIRTSFLESNGNMSLIPPSAAVVAFEASGSYLCSGNSIQFTDLSACTPNTFLDTTYWTGHTFNWTFISGGNVYNSTLQNPLMTFPVSGVYDVSLSVTNGFGTTSHTEVGFVVAGAGPIGACTPATSNEGNFAQTISNVSFNTINNGTSSIANVAYTDFACSANTVVTEGTTHQMDIDIRAGGSAAEVVEVYIDYDNSGTFDAGELVLSGTTATSTTSTITGSVIIPTTAVEGTLLRMRVYGEAGTLSNNERNCISSLFIGDVEDYGVYIMASCVTPTIASGTTTDPSTCGGTDGSIQITGTGTGVVSWTGSASGSSGSITLPYTITGLGAGTYNVTFNNGCASNVVVETLSDSGVSSTPIVTVVDNCGTSTLTGTGVNLVWSTTETTSSITVATAGSYTVTQTVGGCISLPATGVANPIAIPSTPVVTVVDNCGTSTLTTTGTSLVWSTTETTPAITVGTAGSYTVTQSVGGCISLSGTGVANPTATPSAPVVTVLDNCGTSTLTTTGTNLLWSTTETTPNITVSTGGPYTVTQTVGGCTSLSGTGVANPGSAPTIASGTTNDPSSCGGTDGSIQITGTGTGVVSWTGTATGNSGSVALPYTITGIGAGTYNITFDNGCASNVVAETLSDPGAPSAPIVTVVDNCGTSTLTATGTNLTWSTTETTPSITVSAGGPYTVTQTVAGCTSLAATGIANPTAIPSAPTVTVVDNCGTSTLTTTGTNLLWSTTETTPSITVSAGGPYTVTQTVGGCISLPGTGVANPTAIPSTPVVTVVDNCGTSTLTTTGSNLTWSTTETTASITVSTGGPYTVTQTVGGCISLPGTGVANPTAVPATPVVTVVDNCGTSTLTATGTNLTWSTTETTASITVSAGGPYTVTQTVGGCPSLPGTGVANPTAIPSTPVLTVVDNCGTSTLTTTGTNLLWSTTETTPSITVSTGGPYTVTQTVGGCTSLAGTGVANPTAIPSTPVVTIVDNCGISTLTTTGTNLLWSTTETTPSITVSTGGPYTVTQTVGGCISLPGTGVANPLAIPATPVITVVDNCGTSTLTATGTNLTWSTTETTASITVSTGGPYTVTSTAGGCTSLPGTGVANPLALPSTPVVTVVDNCGISTLSTTGTSLLWSTTETTPTISVITGGPYTVTQTVGGCVSLPGTGVANPIGIPSVPVVTVVNNCGTSTLTATGSNLVWSTTETTSSITVLTGGIYTVNQTVGGCSSTDGSGVANPLVVPSTPVITVVDGCGTSTLTASGTNLMWSTTETTSSITVLTAGTFTVTSTIGGCTSLVGSGTAAPIATPPAPTVTVVDGCGSSVLTSTGTNLEWSTTQTTTSITVLAAGPYTVTETVSGCISLPATGNANPFAIPSPPSITAGGPTSFCEGDSVDLTSSIATGVVWVTTETTATITADASGAYTVTYTDVNGCSATSSPMIVTEYPLPTVTVGPYANLCNTDAFFTMTGGSPAGGTYSGPGVIGGIFSPATAGVGTHAITYEFTDANGCFNSSTANITIDDCSGINELDDIGLILYPNPVSTLFTIKTEGAIINDVNIYDAAGRLVKTFSIESSNTTLDVSNYATGLYTVEVRVEDKFYRKRITKQ